MNDFKPEIGDKEDASSMDQIEIDKNSADDRQTDNVEVSPT